MKCPAAGDVMVGRWMIYFNLYEVSHTGTVAAENINYNKVKNRPEVSITRGTRLKVAGSNYQKCLVKLEISKYNQC